MAGKKKKKGRKVRVAFKQNRQQRGRSADWTQRFHTEHDKLADEQRSESVRAKGELSRKRTIIVDEDDTPLVDEKQWRRGLVISVNGLFAQVEMKDGVVWECTVRRVLRTMMIAQRSSVTVGDRVWISDQSGHHDGATVGVVERVEERSTILSRRERRGREHAIVANADQLLIVTSVAEPRVKPHLIDRYLVAAIRGDLRPVIVFNKWDLHETSLGSTGMRLPVDSGYEADDESDEERPDGAGSMTAEALLAEFVSLGYTCIRTSAVDGTGIDALRDELRDRVTVLSGQSGVGKSSLLNTLQDRLGIVVREVSDESGKGRHTTTLSRMYRLDFGGHVVDTPGIRAFDLWNTPPGELEACFTEFVAYVPECKFRDCHHTREEGCAVREAVTQGEISARRYASYLKMLEEASRGKKL